MISKVLNDQPPIRAFHRSEIMTRVWNGIQGLGSWPAYVGRHLDPKLIFDSSKNEVPCLQALTAADFV
jgi:hypothetical protein